MSQSPKKPIENKLLAALPPDVYLSWLPNLERVSLSLRQVIIPRNKPIRYVYFINYGVVSLLTRMADGTLGQVGLVGNEGMVGISVFLGVDTTYIRALVQVPGEAMRMRADVFKTAVNGSGPLHELLHRYTYALMMQISQTAVCNNLHSIEQRFCRWLLMNHDRVRTDEFPLTQELGAKMLGVRRASVTTVAGRLRDAGLIRYTRGQITILNRQGIEETVCECYETVKAEFERLLGVRFEL